MAQRPGRITCPRCGANNFDTVTSCWKCSAPVGAAQAAPAAVLAPQQMPGQPFSPTAGQPATQYGQERATPYAQPASTYYPPAGPTGDTGVARRAALALALTIPFLGLPVGWIFMMIEDRNKQAIGRWCAAWSMVGLLLHFVLTFFLFQQSVPFMLRLLVPAMEGAARRGAASPEMPPGLPGGAP